ncbi:MAG: hypothetical protein GYA87_05250 [Christensenellaceae bacterium]|nr:hypothetical protein [Christensenellaceae bacterium]
MIDFFKELAGAVMFELPLRLNEAILNLTIVNFDDYIKRLSACTSIDEFEKIGKDFDKNANRFYENVKYHVLNVEAILRKQDEWENPNEKNRLDKS